jgi:ATP/maltotriose-dependent transcriptional regulator MalT
MRVFWEELGVLGPIYRLVGRGLSDGEIATKLNVTESNVQSCIRWMLHFLQFTERKQLVRYARGLSDEPVVGAAQRRAA